MNDTDFAFRARETANSFRVTASGRWIEAGGECIDHVMDGCFNNGTCVAPDTVRDLLFRIARSFSPAGAHVVIRLCCMHVSPV